MRSLAKKNFFLLLVTVTFSISSHAQDLNGKVFYITSAQNGRCLDVAEYKTENGSVIWLWDYIGGENQKWKMEWLRENIYTIRSVSSNRCFDTDGATVANNGTKIHIWDCMAGNANQQWRLTQLGNGNYIFNPLSAPGRALDADPATAGSNGTRLQLWDQHGAANQQWKLNYISGGNTLASQFNGKTVTITSAQNGRCLDVAENKTGNGSVTWLWDPHGGDNQKWKMEWIRDDIFTFRSVSSNKCFDTQAESLANNGTRLQVWDCMGNANQQWKLTRLANGNFILNPLSAPGRALDADPATAGSNGTRLQLWDQHGAANQQWKIN